jgi:hypothetical protein
VLRATHPAQEFHLTTSASIELELRARIPGAMAAFGSNASIAFGFI